MKRMKWNIWFLKDIEKFANLKNKEDVKLYFSAILCIHIWSNNFLQEMINSINTFKNIWFCWKKYYFVIL